MNCILLIDNNKKRLPNTQKPFLLIYKVIFIKVRDVDYKSTTLRSKIVNLDQRELQPPRLGVPD